MKDLSFEKPNKELKVKVNEGTKVILLGFLLIAVIVFLICGGIMFFEKQYTAEKEKRSLLISKTDTVYITKTVTITKFKDIPKQEYDVTRVNNIFIEVTNGQLLVTTDEDC